MSALTPDMISELLSSQRTRGDYDKALSEFLKSGETAIEVNTDSGVLAGKSADQVKTGLENAKKRTNESGQLVHTGANNVRVIKKEEAVFLIDTSKVEGAGAVTADEADEA